MTFYCANCWTVVVGSATKCPQCGSDIEAKQACSDYADKLIAAPGHPEPTTPIRAAWIPGERRELKAFEPLMELFKQSQDTFIVEAAVKALGKMDDRPPVQQLFQQQRIRAHVCVCH